MSNLLNGGVISPKSESESAPDISDEIGAHEELRAREHLLDRLAEAIPLGLFQVDAARNIVYTNDRLQEILGVEPKNTLPAQLATVVEADRLALERALDDALGEGLPADIDVELRLSGGESRFCTINLRALSRDDGTTSGAIACVADVTDGARMRAELKRRATFDELTGCYNRAAIMRALEANVASGQRRAERAVMFVDLDRFKEVNDRHGHAAGDELLSTVAERLRNTLRSGDLVGRIGGDEFLVVCPEIGGPDQAMRLAERLAEALREDACAATGRIAHKVSIGVAWSDGPATEADELVAQADRAMYESKRKGTGRPTLGDNGTRNRCASFLSERSPSTRKPTREACVPGRRSPHGHWSWANEAALSVIDERPARRYWCCDRS